MPKVIIRFSSTYGPISHAINFFTDSEWSHVDIGTDKGTWIGAHAGSGVQERPTDYCTPTRSHTYELDYPQPTYDLIMGHAEKSIGTPYNYVDILGLFIHDRDMTSKGRVECAMFVFDCFAAGGVRLLNVQPEWSYKVIPETLHLSSKLIGKLVDVFPKEK